MARGVSAGGALALLGVLALPLLGLYRVYQVARVPGTLYLFPVSGAALLLRKIGALALYIGAVAAVLSFASGPIMRALVRHPSESGVEFFVVGMYLSPFASLGLVGLVLFEYSRLIGFEKQVGLNPDKAA